MTHPSPHCNSHSAILCAIALRLQRWVRGHFPDVYRSGCLDSVSGNSSPLGSRHTMLSETDHVLYRYVSQVRNSMAWVVLCVRMARKRPTSPLSVIVGCKPTRPLVVIEGCGVSDGSFCAWHQVCTTAFAKTLRQCINMQRDHLALLNFGRCHGLQLIVKRSF